MARRNTFGEDFQRGFDWGYRMMGNYQSARDIRDLEDEEVEGEYDPNKYAKRMGLQNDLQAQMLAEQDREFGLDATRNTAAALNMVSGDPTPAQAGGFRPDSYSYLGKTYEERPTDIQQQYAKDMRTADIYSKYGLRDEARQARSDARTGRAADMQYNQALRAEKLQGNLDQINDLYKKAGQGDQQALAQLMQLGAGAYNNPELVDDGNIMKFDADGKPLIYTPGSNQGMPALDYFNKLPKAKQQEALMASHMYATAQATGNYDSIINYNLKRRELAMREKYYGGLASGKAQMKKDMQKYLDDVAILTGQINTTEERYIAALPAEVVKNAAPDELSAMYTKWRLTNFGEKADPEKDKSFMQGLNEMLGFGEKEPAAEIPAEAPTTRSERRQASKERSAANRKVLDQADAVLTSIKDAAARGDTATATRIFNENQALLQQATEKALGTNYTLQAKRAAGLAGMRGR